MRLLLLPFTPRYILLTLALTGTVALGWIVWRDESLVPYLALPFILLLVLALIGLRDFFQPRHAILRNYPIAAQLRFIFEAIRPEMRQYFFEGDKDGVPFPRDKRAIVYQRAKRVLDVRPFGTEYNVYEHRYEWLHHSLAPKHVNVEKLRILIGGPACTQPYSASVFNISAMSYGSL